MATLSDGAFRFLSLCAPPPGSAAVAQRLPTALSAVSSFEELAIAAEQHGMEPLVLAHIVRTGLAIPTDLRARLRARQTQHAHAAAVRTRVVADVASAMAQAGAPFLVLKGAALAQLVYGDPRLRPMRDVDLLIRKADAERTLDVLRSCGFTPGSTIVPSHHHHLQGMTKTLQGATVTIELHHELIVRTPFAEPRGYDDLILRSQPLEWGGRSYRTLGCEDMLWHVYAHAFVINTLRPGAIRLLSVADLAHTTEAWIDQIDWVRLRRQYGGRLLGSLHVLQDLVPCSPHVAEVLREQMARPSTAVRAYPIDSDPDWSPALIPVVFWPPEWWFRMRYGITTRLRWVWFRAVGHPARLALSAGRAIRTRLPTWFGLPNKDAGSSD
jgi:putative nucleotidyltransferase-like protein